MTTFKTYLYSGEVITNEDAADHYLKESTTSGDIGTIYAGINILQMAPQTDRYPLERISNEIRKSVREVVGDIFYLIADRVKFYPSDATDTQSPFAQKVIEFSQIVTDVIFDGKRHIRYRDRHNIEKDGREKTHTFIKCLSNAGLKLSELPEIFSEEHWGTRSDSSFRPEMWIEVANISVEVYRAIVRSTGELSNDDIILIDKIIGLSHNKGSLADKFPKSDEVMSALNQKARGEIDSDMIGSELVRSQYRRFMKRKDNNYDSSHSQRLF